jgi:hypothetical protein
MSVQSREFNQDKGQGDEKEKEQQPRGAALFSRKQLARQQTATERFIAFLLLLVSFVGILVFGGGGTAQWLKLQPNVIGTAAALVVQLACTRVQWVFAAQRWRSPWWLLAFGVSTAGTLAGFWPLAHPWLVGALQWAQVPEATAPYIAGGLLIVGAALLDYLPEQILTD